MKNKEETQLEKALKEADEVVDTMLEQPLKDQITFREACLDGVFKALVSAKAVDSEMCVALSYFARCTQAVINSHPDSIKDIQVTMDKETLSELTSVLEGAVKAGVDKFTFKGKELDVKYAKYLVEFLAEKELDGLLDDFSKSKKPASDDDDKIVPFDEDSKSDR